MSNIAKFLALSSISLIILSACNNSSGIIQPLQESSIVTEQSVKEKSKYNSAKDSLWIAQSTAMRWDISAELVRAEATWVDENGSSNWIYYFKSPFKQRALRVDFGGFSQEVPNGFFGGEIREFDWRVDSDKAIAIAKTQGLKDFPVTRMTLERRFANTEWELSTYNGVFRIDAENSKFISKSQKK